MKTVFRFSSVLLTLALLVLTKVNAQTDISGVWEGNLVVAPGQEIDVQFTLESAGQGAYSAVLDAPDQPAITGVAADSVSIAGSTLTIEIAEVSGQFVGEIVGESINGTWTQSGTTFDLNLSPYVAPVLSREDFARVDGSWVGALQPTGSPDFELTVVLEFSENDAGEFVGTLSSPDQGANDIAMDSFEIDGDELSVDLNRLGVEISATIGGNELVGTFQQAGQSFPITFEKGEYEQDGLQISALNFARLQGPWHGQVANLTIVLRVEQEGSNYVAYLDSPDQGASDIPIQELSVDGDNVNFAISAIGGSFTGTIGENSLSGEWSQGGMNQALELVKGPYDPYGNLSAQVRTQLSGTWEGTVNDTDLVFEFSNSGSFSANLSIPSLGASDLSISNIEISGGNISFAVSGIGASFSGTLSANEASGEWTRAGATNPLSLTKQ